MGYFSWLADELTEIEERLAESDLEEISGPLRKAINKAFVKACEADREQRLAKAPPVKTPAIDVPAEAPSYAEEGRSFGWRPGGGATGGAIRVQVKAAGRPVTAPIDTPISVSSPGAPPLKRKAAPIGQEPPRPPGAEAG